VANLFRIGGDLLDAWGAEREFRDAPLDIAAAYDFVTEFRYGELDLPLHQLRVEFQEFLELVADIEPVSILEIGTAQGASLFLLSRVAASGATLVTVDLGGYRRSHVRLLRSFARNNQRIELIRGDSHSQETLENIREAIRHPVDVLFIDGDHTYDGVRCDYEFFSPFVRPGGIIAFHDIVEGPPEKVGGVPVYWAELRARTPESTEIVADYGQGGYGIGVIRTLSSN
jgi:predicted O-methyltransferase YrrM